MRSGFIYTDGQTDDTRLTLAVLRSAADLGARIANYAAAVGFTRGVDGRLDGARIRLNAPGEAGRELTIAARHTINATGIFAEQVEALAGDSPLLSIAPSKGVHLVLRREDLCHRG